MAAIIETPVLAKLYSSDKYTDMTIACNGRKFRVHKAVVCVQSKVFARAMDGNFREGRTGEIDLEDDEPEVVAQMIKWLYTEDYEDRSAAVIPRINTPAAHTTTRSRASRLTSSNQTSTSTSSTTVPSGTGLLFNTKMYIIADKYDLYPLKELANVKYGNALSAQWDSSEFVESLKLLYEETMENDTLLKDVAIKLAGEHAKELLDRREFVALCEENGTIAVEVLRRAIAALEFSKPNCPWHQITNCVTPSNNQIGWGGYWKCTTNGSCFN